MRTKLDLDPRVIACCRESADAIARSVLAFASERTTVSVERATLRDLRLNTTTQIELSNQRIDEPIPASRFRPCWTRQISRLRLRRLKSLSN